MVSNELDVLALSRLAAWVPKSDWVRPLDEWEGDVNKVNASVALRSLSAHLLETYDTPPVLHSALTYKGDVSAASVSLSLSLSLSLSV